MNRHVVYRLRAMILALFFVIVFTPFAQAQNNSGKAMRDKMADIVNHSEMLTNNLSKLCVGDCENTPAGAKVKQKLESIKQAHTRLKNAHARTTDADYQESVRKRAKHKSDGPCNDDVQICSQSQSADLVMAQAQEPEYDEGAAADTVNDLTELDNGVVEVNAILENNALAPPDPAIDLPEAQFFFPESRRPSPDVTFFAFHISMLAEKVVRIGAHYCQQTAVALGFGGNGSSVCGPMEAVNQLMKAIYEYIAFINNSFLSGEVKTIFARTKTLYDQANKTSGDVFVVKEKVEAMGLKLLQLEQKLLVMEQNQQRIIELLSTPQGQRAGFPVK